MSQRATYEPPAGKKTARLKRLAHERRAERETGAPSASRLTRIGHTAALPGDWRGWLALVSPHFTAFGERHVRFWDHVAAITPGLRPRPYIAPWPRKGGKSSSGEHAVAYLAERRRRRFCLYVCGTQDNANDRIQSIETVFARIGGPLARVATNTLGFSRGWKAGRKQTASGFILLGIGLDTVMRGAKVDDLVPDLIVLDDLDDRHDTPAATKKKIITITETILPAGTADCAVFGLQNLIIPHGIFSQLCDGRADFLLDRLVDGPYRAIEGLQTEDVYDDNLGRNVRRITGGEPTWAGQDVDACQNYIIAYGWRAFDREMQQHVGDVEGALWTSEMLNRTRVSAAHCPPLTRIAIGVDPASTSKMTSNETGLIGCGRTAEKHGYALSDRTAILPPATWGRRAVLMLDELTTRHGCPGVIVAESNQGGEMVSLVIQTAAEKLHTEGLSPEEHRWLSAEARARCYDPEGKRLTKAAPVKLVHAAKGKRARAEPIAQLFDEGLGHTVGTLTALEDEMTGWNATDGGESPNRIDALVWAMAELGLARLQEHGHKPVSATRQVERPTRDLVHRFHRRP